ncbi:MAG: rubredoxin-like domain-containing protein [Christensenellales bacterium]
MLFKCTVCGYMHEGDSAPDFCPKCGAPKEKFIALTEEEAKKVYASDRTNDIHTKLMGLAMKIEKLAKEGIEINLDPPCVALFEQAIKDAWILKQKCKAEIATHISRGKW